MALTLYLLLVKTSEMNYSKTAAADRGFAVPA